MSSVPKGRVDFLDYMRVFAFSSVILGHLFDRHLAAIIADQNIHSSLRYLANIFYEIGFGGGAGVIVFFMVSGYIITHVLQSENSLTFIVRRIFRIYPLFIAAVLMEATAWHYVAQAPFPSFAELLPKLLLLGDFFDVPYSLGGVEWTLRVEILFYLFMAVLKSCGLLRFTQWLPVAFVAISGVLYLSGPFPDFAGWTNGYFNMFFPYLLIGVIVYLAEKRLANVFVAIVAISVIVALTMAQVPKYNAVLAHSHFLEIALAVFGFSWLLRSKISANAAIITLSEMTYAIYLTHLWAWSYLGRLVEFMGISFISDYVQRLVILFFLCWLLTKTVEKYGIKIGRLVSARIVQATAARRGPAEAA